MLEKSLKVFDVSDSYTVRFNIETGDENMDAIIRILEFGSPAHDIYPRNAQALHFKPSAMTFYQGVVAGGRRVMPYRMLLDFIFRDHVEHPGTYPYRMYEQGINDIRSELISIIEKTYKEAISESMRRN